MVGRWVARLAAVTARPGDQACKGLVGERLAKGVDRPGGRERRLWPAPQRFQCGTAGPKRPQLCSGAKRGGPGASKRQGGLEPWGGQLSRCRGRRVWSMSMRRR